MAIKTFNSTQFPGLPDTYKIPPQSYEYDASVTYLIDQYCVYEGQIYRCIQTAINRIPSEEPTYWEAVNLSDDIYYFKNKVQEQIAEPFNPSKSYVVGQYVTYNNNFYKFTANHPSASWNPSHVAKATVGHELRTSGGGGGSVVYLGIITLSTNWTGSVSPYSQIVTVSGATLTSSSKVDIQPTADQIVDLIEDGVATLTAENNNGVLTVYCIGGIPSQQMVLQCSVTEVM